MTSPRADKLLLISIASSLRSSFSTWQFPSRPIGDRTRDGWVKMINMFKPCSNMFKVAVSLSASIMQSASVAGNCWHGLFFLVTVFRWVFRWNLQAVGWKASVTSVFFSRSQPPRSQKCLKAARAWKAGNHATGIPHETEQDQARSSAYAV